ncbi:MAG: DUF1295 domain-containing protein [Phycisphaerales bacterium]|nr:DUF1295 domain-containing protein [Phycisphaerales bacterium]
MVTHLTLVAGVAWLYFGGGFNIIGSWFGGDWISGDMSRRSVLMVFSIVLWCRMSFTAFYLLRRRFGWAEFWPVLFATAIYQVGFALLGGISDTPLRLVDVLGIGLFALGSYLNTGSELQRKRFKDDAANKGKLYTSGLFRLARHVNYLGDSLWATGWAILTANRWAALVPVLLTAAFIFFFIPSLSKYLSRRYGEQYDEWAKRTKAFIPFVY